MKSALSALFGRVKDALDPDRALQASMASLIDAAGVKYALDIGQEHWRPGQPLKLLLAGYVGTRNTGADVRVEEMIRQFRTLIGDDKLELTIMTVDPKLSAGYFRSVRQITLPVLFPKFLFDECPKHHGVVACEGSMFKSKFASALTTMMAGGLGLAAVEGKLAVGYGAEAGAMTESLQRFVRDYCREALVICRNEPSREVLGDLDIRTRSGTDTAWTFDPGPLERGRELLRKAGWNGESKVLAVCPINPFWWPVKPDIGKAFAHQFSGQFKDEHYKSIYFHHRSAEATRRYETYLECIADALIAFRSEVDVFPILVGMEQVDRRACQHLAERLPTKPPLFISDEYDMYELVSTLRSCDMLVSSRYHAIVTSMPGLVPSAGITMDERIRNLMNDRGQPELSLEVEDDDLTEKLLANLRRLHREPEETRDAIKRMLPGQLKLMGQMGIDFMDELCRIYPEFPRQDRPRDWRAHLPPLPKFLEPMLEQQP